MNAALEASKARYTTTLRYHDRASKAGYIADKYAPILQGSVLDVGCDQATLRGLIGSTTRYVGVDLAPPADVILNLDEADLPFEDRSFETVICTDVLEHLERCHAVFVDLCRVSAQRLLVSLPNPLQTLLNSLAAGGAGWMRHYGLPLDPPADRHRWFFGYNDAKRFLVERGARHGFLVEQFDAEVHAAHVWLDAAGRNVLDHLNMRVGTVWCLLHRGNASGCLAI